MVQRLGDRGRDLDGFGQRGTALAQAVAEVAAGDELVDDVAQAVVGAPDVVDRAVPRWLRPAMARASAR
jgi:hypothetical protein